MSLRNRARKLVRESGLTYQQALAKLRAEKSAPKAPKIEVVTVEATTRAELACQQLLHTSGARAVNLVDGWKVLASAGMKGAHVIFHPMGVLRRGERLPRTRKTIELGGVLRALIVPVKKLHLIVVYDEGTSLFLLEKRVDKCVEYLESLITDDDPLLSPPDSGESGPGGLGAVAWESVEIWKKKKP